MVVDDFYVEGLSVGPLEADSKPVVHADAPLSGTITGKRLEPVAGRNAKVLYPRGGVNHSQLALAHVGETRETRSNNTVEKSLRVGIFESHYHIGGGYGITSGYHRQVAKMGNVAKLGRAALPRGHLSFTNFALVPPRMLW